MEDAIHATTETVREEYSARITEQLGRRYHIHIICTTLVKETGFEDVPVDIKRIMGLSGMSGSQCYCLLHLTARTRRTARLKARRKLRQIEKYNVKAKGEKLYDHTII